ncbi:MAG: membrane protein insertase YidC [Campylobacterales bacterium]|nr:membrane protein insertase YidC [Campylobacterales bacterium]
MLDKMSPNQRLIIAVVLSIVFFTAYTAIFPPVQPELNKDVQKPTLQTESNDTLIQQKSLESMAGHAVESTEKEMSSETNTIVVVTSKNFILKVDSLGRIASKELLQEKFRGDNNKHAQLIPAFGAKPLYLRFSDSELNNEAASVGYVASVDAINLEGEPQSVTLTQKLANLTVEKKITFYDDGHYDVDIKLSDDKKYYVYLGQRPKINENEQMMTVVGAMVYTDDDLVTIVEDGDAQGRKTFSGVELISAFDQYNATIMYGFAKDANIIVQPSSERDSDGDLEHNPNVSFEGTQNISFHGYIGQKDYKTLEAINPMLTNAIEYGWFTFAAQPLFALLLWLHGIFGNWGWAIIGLTFIIRVILYPLTHKGMVSMQKIKELAPKLKEIKEKYGKDPQRMNAATMELYKKHGANPLGGCLPMLLQIPVFFAIYRVLLNAPELQGAPWLLWIDDLSRMDPYYILPILMGASMYLQQRMTPNNFTDPLQEKIFKYLPVIFTFFFITFPSGLVLYWFVNNLFSIAQQFIVNQQFANANDAKVAVEKSNGK